MKCKRIFSLASTILYETTVTQHHQMKQMLAIITLNIGGGTIFKVRGPNFGSQKMARKRRTSRLRDAGGCLRGDVPPSEVGAFLRM